MRATSVLPVLASVLLFTPSLPVYAQDCAGVDTNTIQGAFRRVSCAAGLGTPDDHNTVEGVLATAGLIINILLSLAGIVFVILMIYGGFLWMIARGNEDQVKESETLIRNSVIGLIIIFAAFTISTFVLGGIQEIAIGGTTAT